MMKKILFWSLLGAAVAVPALTWAASTAVSCGGSSCSLCPVCPF